MMTSIIYLPVAIFCAVLSLHISIATSNGVSAEVKSVSFDFVMKELMRQRVDIEKQAAQMDRQQAEFEKQVRELERQKSEMGKQRTELEQQKSDLEKQKSELQKLRQDQQESSIKGSSYIRWGRTSCDGESSLLYKGYAAGAKYTDKGAGSNVLCLHEHPQRSLYIAGVHGYTSSIYGVEYEMSGGGNNVFSNANNAGDQLANHPAPCAMCYSSTRSTTVMIPARTECPVGWIKEYQGYIVSEHNNHNSQREYICWDQAPETALGGSNQNQALIYPVEIMCGSLPCSRFTDGVELTCVVCSK